MEEKVLSGKKNGMLVLVLSILLFVLAVIACIAGGFLVERTGNPVLLIGAILVLCTEWILWCGLKVLKPQEALVLTLFGKYIGTLKGEGFYFVNPF